MLEFELKLVMKRILFFHEVFPCGGAERVTIDIANYLSGYGYESFVALCRKKYDVAGWHTSHRTSQPGY